MKQSKPEVDLDLASREAPIDDVALRALATRLHRVATLLIEDAQLVRAHLAPLLDLDIAQKLYFGEPDRRVEILENVSTDLGITREELSILIWAILRNRESPR